MLTSRTLLTAAIVLLLPSTVLAQFSLDCKKIVPAQMPFLSDASGWARPEYYTTIQTARITGKQSLDLVIRGPHGIVMWTWDVALGAWFPGPAGPPLSDAAGWIAAAYYLTIRFGDVDGDGLDEMIARDASGVHTWKYNPQSAKWAEAGAVLPVTATDCADASCYTTFRLGDVNGDGGAELAYRDKNGYWVRSWKGQGWAMLGSIPALSDVPSGWNLEPYYTSIDLTKISSDAQLDVVARYVDGLHVWHWNGTALQELPEVLTDLSDASGWTERRYRETIQYSTDLGGREKGGGVLARDGDGLHYWIWLINAVPHWYRLDITSDSGDFTRADAYWDEPQYYRSIRVAQLNPNDTTLQITALTPNGLGVWARESPFEWKRVGTYSPISPATGWALPQSYLTFQSARVQGGGILLSRGPSSLVTLKFDRQNGLAPASTPGFPAVSKAAYQWISQQLPAKNPPDNIRAHYADASFATMWPSFQTIVKNLKPPANIPPADFETARQQIENEISMIPTVLNWFTLSGAFIGNVFQPFASYVTEVQLAVTLTDTSLSFAFDWLSAAFKILSSISTLALQPEASGALGIMSTVVAMGASGPTGPGGLNPTVLQLLQNLDQQSTNASDANACAQDEFLNNWALMSPMYQGVLNGSMSWDSVNKQSAIDAAHRGYKYWLYQTLSAKSWQILYSGTLITFGYPSKYRPPDNNWYSVALAANQGPYYSPTVSSLDLLFQPPPAGYGTPLYDIFRSRNGWHLPMRCFPESCPSPDLEAPRRRDVQQSVRRLMTEVRQSTRDYRHIRESLLEPLEMALDVLRESRGRGATHSDRALNMLSLFRLRLHLHSGSGLAAASAMAHAEDAYQISDLLTGNPSVEVHGTSNQETAH